MNLTILPLAPELAGDYLYFFDEVAFADHPDWSWCYCLEAYMTQGDEKELELNTKEKRRAKAAEWIADGTMSGYLAYQNSEVVGWMNAADKAAYRRVRADEELWADEDKPGRTLAISCFLIAPAMRGKGIATALLKRVCADARDRGFSFLEAYAAHQGQDCFHQYHGPLTLYEREGFEVIKKLEWCSVVRKPIEV